MKQTLTFPHIGNINLASCYVFSKLVLYAVGISEIKLQQCSL